MAAGMHHPHIVPVYDFGDYEGGFYIVSPLIKGRTLHDLIQEGPLEPREAVQLCIQLLEALAYAHDKGFYHRDVKPQNNLIDEAGDLHLTDFGLAGIIQQKSRRETRMGGVMGTLNYMPPEQARGQIDKVGPASDQYARRRRLL